MALSNKSFSVEDILSTSGKGFALGLFNDKEIKRIKIFDKRGKPYLRCVSTSKERPAKPEEIVR